MTNEFWTIKHCFFCISNIVCQIFRTLFIKHFNIVYQTFPTLFIKYSQHCLSDVSKHCLSNISNIVNQSVQTFFYKNFKQHCLWNTLNLVLLTISNIVYQTSEMLFFNHFEDCLSNTSNFFYKTCHTLFIKNFKLDLSVIFLHLALNFKFACQAKCLTVWPRRQTMLFKHFKQIKYASHSICLQICV